MSEKKYSSPEEMRRTVGIDAPLDQVSGAERLKLASIGLRGTVLAELLDASTPNVTEDAYQLMKHHGMYQQDDRDTRNVRKRAGLDKEWSFMVRTKIPGGVATAEQYLAMDDVAAKYAGATLRLTTRQTIQFHGIVKGDVRDMLTDLNRAVLSTYGACGDVVRNTMCDPVCDISTDPIYSCAADMVELSRQISHRYMPRSCGYYDIYINDEDLTEQLAPKATRNEEEDIYGPRYMPRKFKIGLTVPENNSVDVYTQDLGIVVIRNDDGSLRGYNILAGGGLGHGHGKKETFPRAADDICFVEPADIMSAIHEVITIQRDYGNRADRKQARLKYVLHEVGADWFREEMGRRMGKTLAPAVPIANWGYHDHLGWNTQPDGLLYVGIFVENGRIKDTPELATRSLLRRIVEQFRPQVRITPQQNIVLSHIRPEDKAAIQAILDEARLSSGNGWLSTLRRGEVACVALPTCGLALAESERVLPTLIDQLEALGHADERISIRMSGCPNSCSRAPMAEVGIIGRAPGKYNLYLGGDYEGLRVNTLYKETLPFDQLAPEISRLIKKWHGERQSGEAFGDYCLRLGNEALAS